MLASQMRVSGFRILCAPAALAAVTLLAATGCGGTGVDYPSAELQGSVTIDGVPVESGRVNFMPGQGVGGVPVSADIREGRYVAEHVPLGQVNVTFAITRETGNMISAGDQVPYPETVSIVPAQYQQGIVLEVAGDSASQHFALTTTGSTP